MKKFTLVFIILFSNSIYSQSIVEIDSVSYELCDHLKTMNISNDTLKINTLYETKLRPYLESIDQTKVQTVNQQLYYRLQRNCVDFRILLDRLDPPKEAVKRSSTKPISKITKSELNKFKRQVEFYYFEVSGDTTKVLMDHGKWTDSFADNTYSKLDYKWLNNTEFELIFLESNNHSRSNFSVNGDTYVYQVLEKEDDYYLMSLNIPGQTTYETFRLYYK